MNKTNIEWTDYTWNPVTGCLHDCWYCYGPRIAKRRGDDFKPKVHYERFGQPAKVKKPSKIFVCSMADLFGSWVPVPWIKAVQLDIHDAPQHTYQLLTKNPMNIRFRYGWNKNVWLGTTITTSEELSRVEPLRVADGGIRFISFEPLLGPIELLSGINRIDWIIIGAMTGPGSYKHQPEPEWVQYIIDWARKHGKPVFLKGNLNWPETIQEFPEKVNA